MSLDKVFAKKQMVVLFSVLWKDSSSQFSEQSEILVHLEVHLEG